VGKPEPPSETTTRNSFSSGDTPTTIGDCSVGLLYFTAMVTSSTTIRPSQIASSARTSARAE
jgi:hypothetical protein